MGIGLAIDFLVLLFLIWSLFRGYKLGFLFQLGQLALMVVGYFAARGLGSLLAGPLTDAGVSPAISQTIGFFAVFFVVVLIGSLLLRRITRDLRESSKGLSSTDRALGLVTGGAKGVLIAYVIIVGLIMAHRMTGKVPIPWHNSISGGWVLANNFLDSDDFPRFKALAKIGWLVGTRDLQTLSEDPHISAILTHEKASVLRTPEVLAAIGDKDFVTLLNNDELMDFLDEPEIQGHLNSIEWVAVSEADTAEAPPALTP